MEIEPIRGANAFQCNPVRIGSIRCKPLDPQGARIGYGTCSEELHQPRNPPESSKEASCHHQGCRLVSRIYPESNNIIHGVYPSVGAFASDDVANVVLSLVIMGLDPLTSGELATQLSIAIDVVCIHGATDYLVRETPFLQSHIPTLNPSPSISMRRS